MRLWIDLETYSTVPITHGTHAYAEAAEILLFAWAIDNGPVNVWDCTAEPAPHELIQAIRACGTITAHNSAFDRTVIKHAWPKRMVVGSPAMEVYPKLIDVAGWRDTMVKALAHSLPGSLGDLCEVLNIPTDKAKDKDGRRLVLKFCKTSSKGQRNTRETHPEDWARFVEYARLDVEAMRVIDAKLPEWNYRGEELALWHLDQTINDRGVAIDMGLVTAALASVDKTQKALAKKVQSKTDGVVQAATQRDAMMRHIADAYGIALPDLQGSTVDKLLGSGELPADVAELLTIRKRASTSSTAKYKALVRGVSSDGRLRGTLQFCGASRTGRWAGRLVQLQNLPRPSMKQAAIELGIDALKVDVADLLFENVMELTSNAIRSCIIAPPGKKLVVADLSNIEGRVLAWLAGEEWKLKAFRDFDAGTGHDLYKLAYAKSFGIKPEAVSKEQRQVGKVQELALGYEGGVGAFITFATAYAIDLEDMAEQALGNINQAILNEANSALAWAKLNKRNTFGLSDRAWLVCDSFKRFWRYAHPATVALWSALDDAVRAAIAQSGQTFAAGQHLKVRRDGAWLRIRLPSGRYLCYPAVQLDAEGKISYQGVNQYSRKWSRLQTYGGKLAENVTQAVARDVLASAMPEIESRGYRIVTSVHDELITEAPNAPSFSAKHLSQMMAAPADWADGLPLAAAGFEALRYRKD